MVLASAGCLIGGTAIVICAPLLAGDMSAYWAVWSGMLLCGIGWGCAEGAVNPMTTALYPEEKTHRLNVLHAWWPAA